MSGSTATLALKRSADNVQHGMLCLVVSHAC